MDESSVIAQPHVEIYEQFYKELNPGGAPTVTASEAAAFLRRSNLNVQVLGQIWEISDFQRRGVLDKRGSFMAFKLVAAAQQGLPIAPSSLQAHLNPPVFGYGGGSATPSMSQASPVHSAPSGWAIKPQDQAKYDSIFDSLTPEDGKLPGAKVRPVLLNSGLNPQFLAKIWELADQDKDGQLDRIEMAIALHLVYRALQNEPVPSQLPSSLIHPSKAHLIGRRSSSAVPDTFPNGTLRSRAGSMASLDGFSAVTPLANGPSDRSMSAQPFMHRGSVPGTPVRGVSTPSDEWPVDKFECVAQFAACDSDSDGLVSGMDVRPVLVATGLPQPYLAHIWELADINKTGTLNQEQFALIHHLVKMKRRGEELPMKLPSNLVPPSLRQLNLSGSLAENGLETSISAASLGQAAQSDNPEIRQLAEEMEKLLAERREADEQVTQLEADMTVKNSAIRNLQIELQTLETTVKQLERQKAEASRRLGDLDEQIRQLEAAGVAQSTKVSEATERFEQLKKDREEGAASLERDQTAIRESQAETNQLEEEARQLQAAIAAEQRAFETAVDDITKTERETENNGRVLKELAKETEVVQKAMVELQEITSAEDAGDQIKNKMDLLNINEKPSLLNDSFFMSPSTSSSSGFGQQPQQPRDPFAASSTADPFAGADPFASGGSTSAASTNNGFGTSAFAGGDPFGGTAFSSNGAVNGSKPPPPRPVPPKSSARATPVTDDPFANTDPFASQPVASGNSAGAGFADFANFGAFN